MFKQSCIILLFVFIVQFVSGQPIDKTEKSYTDSQKIDVYDFNMLEPILSTTSDKVFIVNFWAMWCKPCVKEMPFFEQYAKENKKSNTEIIFVSLDFTETKETKLKPFLEERKIKSRVIILDDPDSNTWIDKVYPKWSGSIPFTIIFDKENRNYYERPFENIEDLKNAIEETIMQ